MDDVTLECGRIRVCWQTFRDFVPGTPCHYRLRDGEGFSPWTGAVVVSRPAEDENGGRRVVVRTVGGEICLNVTPDTMRLTGRHVIDRTFQSDEYPKTPRGKAPLSVTDPSAQDLLWEYAQRHRAVDPDHSADLEATLLVAGYDPPSAAERARPRGGRRFVRPRVISADSASYEERRDLVQRIASMLSTFELDASTLPVDELVIEAHQDGILLIVDMLVPDRDRSVEDWGHIQRSVLCPWAPLQANGPEHLLHFMRDAMRGTLAHELDEAISVWGERVFDPHRALRPAPPA